MNIEALVNLSFLLILLLLFFIGIKHSFRAAEYRNFIEGYTIPSSILEKFHQHYPDLTTEQMKKVISGFKIFIKCYVSINTMYFCAPSIIPAMPSKLVDKLWHEFSLDELEYNQFCSKALGHIIHYHPIKEGIYVKGMDVIWQYSCGQERIDDCNPKKLPLLFTIDQEAAIEDGLTYDLISCGKKWGLIYC
ncbi:MAG: hypothetical protein QX189_08045 [Methylococcales bacterium]